MTINSLGTTPGRSGLSQNAARRVWLCRGLVNLSQVRVRVRVLTRLPTSESQRFSRSATRDKRGEARPDLTDFFSHYDVRLTTHRMDLGESQD
jgi:hypothetical protein